MVDYTILDHNWNVYPNSNDVDLKTKTRKEEGVGGDRDEYDHPKRY